MVSSALESARSRNLASPAPPHAPSPSAKTALVATTAAQRTAQLQARIRAVRAEEATIAEELAKVRAKGVDGGRTDGRKRAAASLERGMKPGVHGRGALHGV